MVGVDVGQLNVNQQQNLHLKQKITEDRGGGGSQLNPITRGALSICHRGQKIKRHECHTCRNKLFIVGEVCIFYRAKLISESSSSWPHLVFVFSFPFSDVSGHDPFGLLSQPWVGIELEDKVALD